MYSTSQKWKERIYENVQSVFNIYIDDVLIDPNYILDFKVGKTLFDDEELKLGSTSSRYIELQIYKNQVTENISQVKVDYGILINNEYEMIPIGIFNVDDYTDNDDNTLTVKCIDNMSKFEFNYDGSKLTYPTTLMRVLEDICEKAGVEIGSTSFLNSDTKVSVYDNTITAREYLSYISECAGGFACIGRDGKLYIRQFYQDSQEIPLELFGEYKWGEKYNISKVSYENGVESFKFGDDTGNNLWINQENMYIIEEDEVEKIYNQMKEFEAYSFEGKTIIDPALDEGDKLIIDGKSVLYQGEADFQGRFIAEISSKIAIKEKQETTVKETSQKLINRRVQSRIDEAEGKITQLVQETDENSEKISEVTQTLDEISQEVTEILDFEKTVKGINELFLEDALKMNIIGFKAQAQSVKGIYPSKKLFPNKKLFPKKGGTTITLLIGTYSRYTEPNPILPSKRLFPSKKLFPKPKVFMKKEYSFYINTPLRSYGEKSDEFVIEIEKDTGICVVKVLRYITYQNGSYLIYDKPKEEIIDKLDIELYEGNNYISLKEFTNWNIEATYLFNTKLNKEFASRMETNAKIRQTADAINLEVSKKVNEDEIISSINLSPEEIRIKSNKMALEGYTTINEGFSIDEKGNMTCRDAKINGALITNGSKFNVDEEGNMTCKEATMDSVNIRNGSLSMLVDPNSETDDFVLVDQNGLRTLFWGNQIRFNNGNLDGQGIVQIGIFTNDIYRGYIDCNGEISCETLQQWSDIKSKKNIKKLGNKVTKNKTAMDIVKKADICEYNYKNAKGKKYGMVIGEGYNYPEEIVSKNARGMNCVDLYGMVSLLWKAVQEQQTEIENLKGNKKSWEENK